MTTAKEIRDRGRVALKHGGWWPMLGGVAVWNVLWTVLVAIAVTVLYRFFGVQEDLCANNLLAVFCKVNLCLLPFALVAYYFAAVNRFSVCAMGMATVRGGVRFAHALSGFGKGWSMVWLMGFVHFAVFAGTLCFIVPGIVMAIDYSQAYYLKVDHPEWKALRCMSESRRLMRGSRWRYVRFCLSFFGWFLVAGAANTFLFGLPILCAMTYFLAAQAAFYEDLLDKHEEAPLDNQQAQLLRDALGLLQTSEKVQ